MAAITGTCDVFELGDCSLAGPGVRPHRIFQAVIQVIVDQGFFGGADRALHCVQLLNNFEGVPSTLHHCDDVMQVAIGALEPVQDLRMG